jgi:hypothetical protein
MTARAAATWEDPSKLCGRLQIVGCDVNDDVSAEDLHQDLDAASIVQPLDHAEMAMPRPGIDFDRGTESEQRLQGGPRQAGSLERIC